MATQDDDEELERLATFLLGVEPRWMKRGLCKGAHPDSFFPPRKGKGTAIATAAAERVCENCPVIDDCFKYAFEPGKIEHFGVWAGLSANKRKKIRSARVHGEIHPLDRFPPAHLLKKEEAA